MNWNRKNTLHPHRVTVGRENENKNTKAIEISPTDLKHKAEENGSTLN